MTVTSVAARMTPRTMAWTPLAATTVLAASVMFGHWVVGGPSLAPAVVSVGAATLVAGAAAALEDPARDLVAPLPVGTPRRLLYRVSWIVLALAASAVLVGVLARRIGYTDLTWSAVSTVASLAAISVALFAVVERRRPDLATVAASAAPGAFVAVGLAAPDDKAALHLWSEHPWWVVVICAVVTCTFARR